MAYWGLEGGRSQENILSPLGLHTSGGRTKNDKLTYMIYDNNNKFFCELEIDKIKDIYNYFPEYIRKDKIKKIKERICSKTEI